MSLLHVRGLCQSFSQFGNSLVVLNNYELTIDPFEVVALVGLSGCGKTSLARIVAGLDCPTEGGSVTWRDRPSSWNEVAEHVSYMPQTNCLLPWMTVVDNISVPQRVCNGVSRSQARERSYDLLSQFGLEQWADNYPHTLSGGMASRVSFLRALATDKPLLVVDEPFAALDAITRRHAQAWLESAWSGEGAGLFITHSLDEAVAVADRVVVMGERGHCPAGEVRVDIPRPRTGQVRHSPEFTALVARVADLLEPESQPSAIGS